jgi:hypothetical protein
MLLQYWGATPDEIAGPVAGDHLVRDARLIATRSITLDAPPAEVFPWLRQMGFGRAGWYSYDLLDNLGRHSADRIHPEWQQVSTGDLVPGGPATFVAAVVDEPRAFVLELPRGGRIQRRIAFTLAYDLRPAGTGTRLVTRIRGRIDVPLGGLIERCLLGPGDGIMVRRQLLNLAARTGRP